MGIIHPTKPRFRKHKDTNGTTYLRQNRKTGVISTVTLCHPCTTSTEKQKRMRSDFGILNSAVNRWIAQNRNANSEVYQRVMKKFNRQDRYKLLRCFMVGTRMATVQSDGLVVISIDSYSATIINDLIRENS